MLLRITSFLIVILFYPVLASESTSKLTLEKIFKNSLFRERAPQNGKWIDDWFWYIIKDSLTARNKILRFDPSTSRTEIILESASLIVPDNDSLLTLQDFQISMDRRSLLLFTDTRPLWRQNTLGYYYLYDLEKNVLKPVSTRVDGFQMFAKFSPDRRYVGFVRNGNLWLHEVRSGTETPLTCDGKLPDLLNGISDWVYEEEFQLRDGWCWSPDGRYIAFYQFDTTPIPEFIMTDERPKLPRNITVRYPQAGGNNSNVRIGLIDLEKEQTRFIDTGTWVHQKQDFEYLPAIGWTPDNRLWIMRLNRHQNDLQLLFTDAPSLDATMILEEKSASWIESSSVFDMSQRIKFYNDGRYFFWASDHDGFNHIYLYDLDGKLQKQITHGSFDVMQLEAFDEKRSQLYFTASIGNPLEKHLYRTNIDSEFSPIKITSVSGSHESIVAPDGHYFYDSYSSVISPKRSGIYSTEGALINMIEDNHSLANELGEFPAPVWTFDSLMAEDGTHLYSFMIKPYDFDPAKKYPLLIYTYGGPTAQIVTNSWKGERGLWYQYLTGELSMIIAGVDNRGSINRGKAFLTANYLHLGTVEPEDQIHAARIWGQLPYIDSKRIAIWGWSYGGINTLLSLCKFDGPDVFRMGIAVAPVVSWELYDTIYTERYLMTPGENPTGYFKASPVNYVQNLHPDQYLLLIHGTLDDNVHFQNSIRLIQALERANKPFHLMIYPGANHSMGRTGNKNTKLHLYQTITNFLKEYL